MARTSHKIDVNRLCLGMQRGRRMLERFRAERREMVKEFVGRHWSDRGARHRVPVNLIALYISVVGRNLIAKNPRVMLSTFDRAMKPTVSAMQAWCNLEIEQTRLQNTLQRVVTDALFSVGICKVALATPAESAHVGWTLGAGQPFAERVDLDDFVFDAHARDFSECGFIGHRYRVPREAAIGTLGKKARDLQASDDYQYNEQGDERISMLGRGYQAGDTDELEDMIDLWEVYLPREREVWTLPDDYLSGPTAATKGGSLSEPLLRQPWIGPETGPYHVCAYGLVPGNAMPKGPIQDLLDLHLSTNRSYRKMIEATDRTKEITLVRRGAAEDGKRVMDANDGDMIGVDDPQNTNQIVYGGQHVQHVLGVATELKNLFSFMGGNLELLGGRGPQAKTATQDAMLNQNAGAGVADMQMTTVDFAASVLKGLCWYWWKDPVAVQQSMHSLPGSKQFQVKRIVTPAMRQRGRFEDLQIRVDPYSLPHQTPETRLTKLNQIMQTIILPLMPLLQQQGISVDLNKYLQKVGEWLDMPDLNEILTIQQPPQQGQQGGGGQEEPERPGMPAQTERSYVRHNVSEQTPQGGDRNMVQSLFGVNPGGNPKNGQTMGARQ